MSVVNGSSLGRRIAEHFLNHVDAITDDQLNRAALDVDAILLSERRALLAAVVLADLIECRVKDWRKEGGRITVFSRDRMELLESTLVEYRRATA